MAIPVKSINSAKAGIDIGDAVISVEIITPEIATEMLGYNVLNRHKSGSHINYLAGALQRGEWIFNGDAIRFDLEGDLIDGQHRLEACVESEESFVAIVVRGLPKAAQKTVDINLRRNLGHALQIAGEKSASSLAATINYFWRWQVAGTPRATSNRPSFAQAFTTLEEHPRLRQALADIQKLRSRFRVSQGMSAANFYVLESIDSEDCHDFHHALISGEGLNSGSPILVLRQYLERETIAGVGARANVLTHHAHIIKAWNAYRDGVDIERLSWKSGGLRAEAFPVPH